MCFLNLQSPHTLHQQKYYVKAREHWAKRDAPGSSYIEKVLLSVKRIASEVKGVQPKNFFDEQTCTACKSVG